MKLKKSFQKPRKAQKMNLSSDNVVFRAATQADVNFIFNSWLKSNRYSPSVLGCENPVYFAQHHMLIQGLLKHSNVLMAVNATDTSQIYGYIVHQNIEGASVVHYLYVKEPYRLLGLAKMLMTTAGIDAAVPFFVTHNTTATKKIMSQKSHVIFNPYLAFYAYEEGRKAQKEARIEAAK